MKFTTTNSPRQTYFKFSEVGVGRLCVDIQGDLLFKTSYNSSVRIAKKGGALCGKVFDNMATNWDIEIILSYDKVEF
jgi:hypothetical protein